MAFTIETGEGVNGANAYITEAYFETHHTDRGRDVSSYASGIRESAIIRATDYVDKRFGQKFRGYKQSRDQGLEWPRISAFDNDDYLFDDIPEQLQKAVAEYTLLALQFTELLPVPALPFPERSRTDGSVSTKPSGQTIRDRSKVGPIEKETWHADNSNLITRKKPSGSSSTLVTDFNLPEYPVADEWIQELLKPGFTVGLSLGN